MLQEMIRPFLFGVKHYYFRLMADHAAIILFDGECNLCNGSVNFIIDRDPAAYFSFAALQSEEAQPHLETCREQGEALKTVVLLEDGECYTRSTAALRIARKLTGAWPLLFLFLAVPVPVRDGVYDFISRHRYAWFGKRDACRVPSPELRARFL